MEKYIHEIRDPIHTFIRLDADERKVLDSRPFQRLRHIHQLALSHLVYPGATHMRFEHSLGTMEMATRIFDVVTAQPAIHNDVRDLIPELSNPDKLGYWRRVLRMAALCHDIGHLPFSHAAEKEILPEGWKHENLSVEVIKSAEMKEIWKSMTPPLRSSDIAKVAVGMKYLPDEEFSDWEIILSEIIIGDAFGADRIDYLLRDSHHAGVAYGKFDHFRLLDTLRILQSAPDSKEPSLGVERGGIQSAEALLLARYFMYSQVYFHPVRRIYDHHLIDFMGKNLPNGTFQTSVEHLMDYTDVEVLISIFRAAKSAAAKGHDAAKRILERNHFKNVYSRNPADAEIYTEPGRALHEGLSAYLGSNKVVHDSYTDKGGIFNFPVLDRDGRIVSSVAVSPVLANIPPIVIDDVFVAPECIDSARAWLECNRDSHLQNAAEGQSQEDEP